MCLFLVCDLLLLSEREKNPIGDMTEMALAAKADLPLLPAEVRLLHGTIFDTTSNYCCTTTWLPRPWLLAWGAAWSCGGNSMTLDAAVLILSTARR